MMRELQIKIGRHFSTESLVSYAEIVYNTCEKVLLISLDKTERTGAEKCMCYCCFIPNKLFAAFSNTYSLSSCGGVDKSILHVLFPFFLIKHWWKQKRDCTGKKVYTKHPHKLKYLSSKSHTFLLKKCWKGLFKKVSLSKRCSNWQYLEQQYLSNQWSPEIFKNICIFKTKQKKRSLKNPSGTTNGCVLNR